MAINAKQVTIAENLTNTGIQEITQQENEINTEEETKATIEKKVIIVKNNEEQTSKIPIFDINDSERMKEYDIYHKKSNSCKKFFLIGRLCSFKQSKEIIVRF